MRLIFSAPTRLAWAAAFVLSGVGLAAENWPQWRGPASQGISTESGLPLTWSEHENVAWRAPLAGLGTSSPIVWGDRVIVTSQIGSTTVTGRRAPAARAGRPRARRARDADRRAAWRGQRDPRSVGPGDLARRRGLPAVQRRAPLGAQGPRDRPVPDLHEKHNLATPTPATDGERAYAWFGNGQVVALDMEGQVVWTRHLGEDYAPFQTQWGHGSSPALHGDLVIFLCDHRRASYLLALEARTGKERWKVDRGAGRVSHSTPLVVPGPRGDELLVNSSERIDAYDPKTGELLWYTGSQRQTPIPSAVFHDGRIYLSRGYRNSDYLAIRPGGRGDVTATHVDWRVAAGASYVPSIVYYDGLLYMTNEVGVVSCADARTGEAVWRHRLGGVFFASPVAGDGKVYFVSETGETFVLRAGRSPEVLARNELSGRFLASPAIAQGRLFLRSDGALFAVGR